MKFSRVIKIVLLSIQRLPMKSTGLRPMLCKMAGVNIVDYKRVFIGEDVYFDNNYPEDIKIEKDVCITSGSKFITHFMSPDDGRYERGTIEIGRGAYIGMNTIVCKPVSIGRGSIVGAGSVVTKNIPAGEVWAGNPARFIKMNPRPDWRIRKD